MSGFGRMEVKVVSRTSRRSDGSVGRNSAVDAGRYITASEGGKSKAIEAAAYISGSSMVDEGGSMADYSRKKGVVFSEVVLPQGVTNAERLLDPEVLWKEIELIEGKNSKSDLYREFIASFPKELSMEDWKDAAREFAESLASEGMVVHYALHSGADGNDNIHGHYLCTTRGLTEDGRFDERKIKPMKYLLDENGKRIPSLDKNGNQRIRSDGCLQWKRSQVEFVREFNNPKAGNVDRWRKEFESIVNKRLPDKYHICMDSYEKQGIDKIPGVHLGKAAFNTQKRINEQINGLPTERKSEYLEKMLAQIQHDYRKAYYDNSRKILAEKKNVIELKEHFELRREIKSALQSVKRYVPSKKYVSSLVGQNYLLVEKGLSDMFSYFRRQAEQDDEQVDVDAYVRAMEMIARCEEALFTTYAYGMTKSVEQFVFQSEYEMKREELKTLGLEIRETEAELRKLQEGEEIDESELEGLLRGYRLQLNEITGVYCGDGAAEGDDCRVVNSARRVSESVSSIGESQRRLGSLREKNQHSVGRIISNEYRKNEEKSRNLGKRK